MCQPSLSNSSFCVVVTSSSLTGSCCDVSMPPSALKLVGEVDPAEGDLCRILQNKLVTIDHHCVLFCEVKGRCPSCEFTCTFLKVRLLVDNRLLFSRDSQAHWEIVISESLLQQLRTRNSFKSFKS